MGAGSCGGWQVEVSSSRAWVEGKGGGVELWRLACFVNLSWVQVHINQSYSHETVASTSLSDAELPTLLVFPYFMESHLSTALHSLTMSDYQVLCSLLSPPLHPPSSHMYTSLLPPLHPPFSHMYTHPSLPSGDL